MNLLKRYEFVTQAHLNIWTLKEFSKDEDVVVLQRLPHQGLTALGWGCGIFHAALSGSWRFLGFKETSQILGPDAAASEILWHLDWNCQGEQHCVQRCPKCWLFVSVSFLLQPDWLPLRHPQPFVIWRCEILEPLRCHRYSISRFPVRVRVQTSVNEGFATTGHTPAEGMKSWRYYEKIWTFFAYSSCDVLQEFHLFSLKFEYNFGVSRHMYAQITEASNRWHARWDLCSM